MTLMTATVNTALTQWLRRLGSRNQQEVSVLQRSPCGLEIGATLSRQLAGPLFAELLRGKRIAYVLRSRWCHVDT